MTPAPESNPIPSLEVAHVLFMDIVAYSMLPMDQQQKLLGELQEAVRATPAFARAQAHHQLIRLPTGDGMALVFFRDPEAPARCALELSRALRDHPDIKLRMGIHSGPVYRVADINANRNVAGGGINIAQRVMDFGDAGHILVSKSVADVLSQISSWNESLQDLGEAEVKHGVRVHLFNLRMPDAGNPEVPKKVKLAKSAILLEGSRRERPKPSRMAIAAICVLLLVALGLGGWLYFARHTHALTEKDTIVLADFTNTTGDPVFDGTLKQGLAAQLGQSPFLHVLSDRKVSEILKLMGRSTDAHLDEKAALDLCQRSGIKAVLAGSIATLGSQYVIGLNAADCQTGDSLAQEQVQAVRKEEVLKALGEATTKLRRELGESLKTVQKYDTPIEKATTPSLEALRAYSQGELTRRGKGDADAIPFFKRAIELDPNFAMAYAALGDSYSNLNEPGLGSENLQKAYDLRDRVSEREKLSISASYYMVVTEELDKANESYSLWSQAYPRHAAPHGNLGFNYFVLGQYEKALTETLEAIRLDPDLGVEYGNLVALYAVLNRLDDAKATYQQALSRKLDNSFLHDNRYAVAFLQGDTTEMERQVAWTAGKPSAEDHFLSIRSDTEAFFGRLTKAQEFSRRAAEFARRNDQKETAAEWQMDAALREAEFGNADLARQETASALALVSTREVQILAALALTRVGDAARAEKLADDLARKFPLNTVLNGYWLPTIRASIEINRKSPAKAIEFLQAAIPYELGEPSPEFEVGGVLYPAYVRGQAYLLLHQGSEAAGEFQKYLDHRGIVVNCPLGALAHLGLARAYALQGDTAKARTAYQDFFALWKDADTDIPILKEAKSEYAKLNWN